MFFKISTYNKHITDETDNVIASTSSNNQESNEKKNEKVGNDLNNEEKEDSEISEANNSCKRKGKQKTRLFPQKDLYKSAQQFDFAYVSRKNYKKTRELSKMISMNYSFSELPKK